MALSTGVSEEAGPQAGTGLVSAETCPTPHQVPAAAQGAAQKNHTQKIKCPALIIHIYHLSSVKKHLYRSLETPKHHCQQTNLSLFLPLNTFKHEGKLDYLK